MTHGVSIRRSSTVLAAVLGTFAVGSAGASAATPTAASTTANSALAACTAPTLTQPFSPLSDANYYAPLPGESWDSFPATNWTLSGGAKVVTTKLADGATGTALDLPASAKAVSSSMCLTNDYPSARGQIRSVSGSAGVTVTVTYLGTKQQSAGFLSSTSSSWSLATPVTLNPSSTTGWQLAQFTFVAANKGEYQLSNFYVDPKMRH